MKSKDYEYKPSEEEYEISETRKNELIEKVKNQVRKGFIAHYQILDIGKNDDEYDFLYSWLDDNGIEIRGINGTISGEIPNYNHIPKMGQSFTPEKLDDKEQEQLFWKLQQYSVDDIKYQQIRNKIIEHNMKLAKWVTSWREITKLPIPIEDKYQMAYLGLIYAVDRFDPSLGYKFSTYACNTIYRKIAREAYREGGETKQVFVVKEQLAMIADIKNQIQIRLGRKAKPYEIADIMGISVKRVYELETLRTLQNKESLEQIDGYLNDVETVSSQLLDSDRAIETDNGYVVEGVYMEEPDILPKGFRPKDIVADKAMATRLKNDLKKVLLTLTEREQGVLSKRFGLIDGIPMTLGEVGKSYNLSRNRISQIEDKALRKLRHPSKSRFIKSYLEDIGNYDGERDQI